MNRTELLDGLYAVRRDLLHKIMSTGSTEIDPERLKTLVTRRDQITWTINALIDAELLVSASAIDDACKQIEAAAHELAHLTHLAADIDKAISIASTVLEIAGKLIPHVVG
jgi:hypothetical protein